MRCGHMMMPGDEAILAAGEEHVTMESVKINGKRFLVCHRDGCQWNLRYLSGNAKSRVCNFGALAFAVKGEMPRDCPYLSLLSTLVATEMFEHSLRDSIEFWDRMFPLA